MEYYKSLSTKEMAELDQKKSSKKKGYFSLAMQVCFIQQLLLKLDYIS